MKIDYPIVEGTEHLNVDFSEIDQEYEIWDSHADPLMYIRFHEGPVEDREFNGVTLEALLAICKHRLENHQSTQFACMENDIAINHIRQAIAILNQRTQERLERGVQGKQEV